MRQSRLSFKIKQNKFKYQLLKAALRSRKTKYVRSLQESVKYQNLKMYIWYQFKKITGRFIMKYQKRPLRYIIIMKYQKKP